MRRALQLAQLGLGAVSPNPMVGCVIVKAGKIIGEGNHEKYGEGHAEVKAVRAVKNDSLIEGSTVFVTLEPCAHYGKTPPCAHLLVEHKVRKVVICNLDPNPLVAGKGVEILEKAGIEVVSGVLQEAGREINRRFFTFFEKKRPYVILKWAQTKDGYVARENYDSKWISNEHSRQLVHKWRAEEDAILVGKNTAQYDNPSLTTRNWVGADPIRVVLDSTLSLNKDLNLFDGSVFTLVFNTQWNNEQNNVRHIKLESMSPKWILQALFDLKIQSIIVEGGSTTLQSFIDAHLWDEARIFESENTFGTGISAPNMKGKLLEQKPVERDLLTIYQNK
ncbi:MAG: diaminohydroxyphosphoribosylaminopyrimidine deaminase [Gammaproteobacteria bacterium]|jgi:diaminohydroxyphosphoribosylaminopyrimidine deaminase/5-amino-6-(5-phosphoribosylamino)uracil reductase